MGNCRDDAGDIKLVLLISKGSNNFHLIFIDMITKCLKKKTSSPKGNDRSPESNVPRSNLISKNSNSSKL